MVLDYIRAKINLHGNEEEGNKVDTGCLLNVFTVENIRKNKEETVRVYKNLEDVTVFI